MILVLFLWLPILLIAAPLHRDGGSATSSRGADRGGGGAGGGSRSTSFGNSRSSTRWTSGSQRGGRTDHNQQGGLTADGGGRRGSWSTGGSSRGTWTSNGQPGDGSRGSQRDSPASSGQQGQMGNSPRNGWLDNSQPGNARGGWTDSTQQDGWQTSRQGSTMPSAQPNQRMDNTFPETPRFVSTRPMPMDMRTDTQPQPGWSVDMPDQDAMPNQDTMPTQVDMPVDSLPSSSGGPPPRFRGNNGASGNADPSAVARWSNSDDQDYFDRKQPEWRWSHSRGNHQTDAITTF